MAEQCLRSRIAAVQLFHELKQAFPSVPDEVVARCVTQNALDKAVCERELRRAARRMVHPALMTGPGPARARGPAPGMEPPPKCPAEPYPITPPPAPTRPRSPQPTSDPVSVPRVTSSVRVQPAPHFVPVVPPRSYTSVNLTLRPPSSEPQPPIDIHSAGSSLTYSTSSYDPRQGYQSQLQIRIGPGGLGSVSALRTRAPVPPPPPPRAPAHPSVVPLSNPADIVEPRPVGGIPQERIDAEVQSRLVVIGGVSLRPETRDHLVRQLEQRAQLEAELRKESNKLLHMQREVVEMERDLQRRTAHPRPRDTQPLPVMQKVQRLRTEIQQLQNECTRMAHEVDVKSPVTLPLGETNEEFYKNIYTGQRGSLWPRLPLSTPRRPEESGSESGWTCQVCTFHNYYLLEACETCDMPRIRIGSATSSPPRVSLTPRVRPQLQRQPHVQPDTEPPPSPPPQNPPQIPPALRTAPGAAANAALSHFSPPTLRTNPAVLCALNSLTHHPNNALQHEERAE